jgi:arabinofuranosyltransferase
MLAAAALDTAYIVATGGDYMHGRLLLPALFAVALPASFVIHPSTIAKYAALSVGIVWAVVCASWMRYVQPPNIIFGVPTIADQRVALGDTLFPGQKSPLASTGMRVLTGVQVHRAYVNGERGYLRVLDTTARAGRYPHRLIVTMGSIGVPAYTAGREVWIVDIGGLAEPLAARSSPIPGRAAGHRKSVDTAWYDAEFGAASGDAKVGAARRALRCEPVSGLLAAIDEPLTPSRFLSNIWHSPWYTLFHVPSDPVTAERELCR